MPPTFSLQNVLDIRHDLVEALEVELGRLLQIKVSQQSLLDHYLDLQADLMVKLGEAQTGELDLFHLRMLHENILSVDNLIVAAREKLFKIVRAVENKQAELIKARQNEETLATLKNKRLEIYNAELAQYEAHVQDDIYISQAFRNRGLEGHA
jgi:flagellar export protein FliJ